MKKLALLVYILTASLLILSCGHPKEDSTQAGIEEEITSAGTAPGEIKISETELANTLQYLSSDELQGRMTGTSGIEKAATLIESTLRENNIQPYFQTYRDSFDVKGTTGYNIVGFKEGTDPELKDEFIVIGAHYDHIGEGKPVGGDTLANGANDNASGTTAVLELAKYFGKVETGRSILFTLYSAEEMGLVGSKHLANRLKEEGIDLYVMFNIEMIGIPMEDKSYSAYVTGYELSNLSEKFNEYAGGEVLGFLPQAKEYNLFMRSDNYPFYEAFGMPAQTISSFDFTNYDYYHHVDDEYENMNIPHMVTLIKEIIPGLSELANSATREVKMNTE